MLFCNQLAADIYFFTEILQTPYNHLWYILVYFRFLFFFPSVNYFFHLLFGQRTYAHSEHREGHTKARGAVVTKTPQVHLTALSMTRYADKYGRLQEHTEHTQYFTTYLSRELCVVTPLDFLSVNLLSLPMKPCTLPKQCIFPD